MNKTKYKHFRMTEEQENEIYRLMEEKGIKNFSQFALSMILHGKFVNIDLSPIFEMNKEINRIGVNINQLTKIANEKKDLDIVELQYIQDSMSEIYSMLAKNTEQINKLVEDIKDI